MSQPLAGQDSPDGEGNTDTIVAEWIRLNEVPERLTHQNRAELGILYRDLQAPEPARQEAAVRRIERLYRERRELSPELTDLLVFAVVGPFTTQRVGAAPALPGPVARISALELLGDVGGVRARRGVLETLRHERDTAVLSAAVVSLGSMRPPPSTEITGLLTGLLEGRSARREPQLVRAILETTRILGQPPYAISDPDLYRAILAIAQGPYPRSLREHAYELVDELREPR